MKLVNKQKLKHKEDVYDLEVPKYHNFSVGKGLIIHNSIDATRYALEKYISRKGN